MLCHTTDHTEKTHTIPHEHEMRISNNGRMIYICRCGQLLTERLKL